MPFQSQSQRAFMYSQHPEIAKRWEKETPKGKLPDKKKRKIGSYEHSVIKKALVMRGEP